MASLEEVRQNWPITGEKVFHNEVEKPQRTLVQRIAELEERLAVVSEAMERFSKETHAQIDRIESVIG